MATRVPDESRVPVSLPDVRSVAEHHGHARAAGAIPQQIDYALEQSAAAAPHQALQQRQFLRPSGDSARRTTRRSRSACARFDTVIVENHPRLCGDDCLRFRDLLRGQLEVALGLETVHEQVLARLNKRMSNNWQVLEPILFHVYADMLNSDMSGK